MQNGSHGLSQKSKAASRTDIKENFFLIKIFKKTLLNSATAIFIAMFKIILIKQVFERNKSLRTDSESQTQFCPKITPDSLFHFKQFLQ